MRFKRDSEIPTERVLSQEGPHTDAQAKCIACFCGVSPGFCHTGSVIDGIGHQTINGTETFFLTAMIQDLDQSREVVIKAEQMPWKKRVSFLKRKKGFLCDRCAANYHTITDYHGVKHEIVKTDPRPGTILRGALKTKGRVVRDGDRLSVPTIEGNF